MAEQITKDLGGITAYAAAVAAGYTGTKAQFETLMASYATVAQNAAASATAAANSKSDAEAFAKGTRNGTPVSSGDAAYENNSKYFAEQAGDYAESLDPDTLAKIDGYYDTLGAGTAEQLTSNIYEEDNVPYNFRTSGGSIDIGDRETDMVVGGTVAWNQLVANAKKAETITPIGDTTYSYAVPDSSVYLQPNRVYAVSCKISYNGNKTLRKYIQCGSVYGRTGDDKDIGANQTENTTWLIQPQTNDVLAVGLSNITTADLLTSADAWSYDNFNIIDLTQMFGSTIADYIYSLEQANAGAGVAWFKKLFPKPYYAYNAGELMSVNTSAHNTVGFNAWDEETESGGINQQGQKFDSTTKIRPKNYIRVLPSTVYYFNIPNNAIGNGIMFYDADKNFISYAWIGSASTVTTPSNANYMLFDISSSYGTTYNHDICINLSWDGERDGEYEAYDKHSYPLDSSLTLRGIPKLDASNNLYYDGDTYASDGAVTRKYGVVDLGSLNWSRNATNQFYAPLPTAGTQYTGNQICTKYQASARGAYDANVDKCVTVTGSNCWVRDSVYDVTADFKASLNGVYLVYELATPTTETADPYTNPQIVNDFGTEEYVDYAVSQGTRDVAIPVGHQTQYMANLKAKLEMSPNSPDGAGDYIVRQTNGENEYVTLASNATIQDIIARLEALEGGGE